MKILTAETLGCRRGPQEYFTGTAWIDAVSAVEPPSRLRANRVAFEPGARTAWHTHPVGQTLHVLSGLGWVQRRGEPAQTIGPGDTVWIAPGEEHWHGAAAGRTMVHLAMQEADAANIDVVWLVEVTDEEYAAAQP